MANPFRRAAHLAAACGLILAAVSTASVGSPLSGAESSTSAATSGPRLALFGFGKSESKPKPPPAPRKGELSCPKVMVQPGTAAHIVYDRGREGDPLGVRFQVRFNEFARECIDFGAEAGIRIGIAARAMLGPQGTPGATVDVPVRFVVINPDREVVVSRVTRLQVAIPAGTAGITFTHVEELAVPMPEDRLKGWDFRVGFDTRPPGAQG